MKEIKKKFLRIFLLVEIIIFASVYFFGKNGYQLIKEINKKNLKIESEILKLKKEINDLELQINQWNKDPYYKEKIAREKLQMAKQSEELYKYN